MADSPRITLFSALAESLAPAAAAMKEVWPEALANNLLDDSLARDLATIGHLSPSIHERFRVLSRYAAAASDERHSTAGILFTCSAFGPVIDAVRRDLTIPVTAPNEGAFEEALDLCASRANGGRVGLALTFAGSLAPLSAELTAMAEKRDQTPPHIVPIVAQGALEALQAGDTARHDDLICNAVKDIGALDVLLLGQFSMARAAVKVAALRSEPVITTPHAAVRKLRSLIASGHRSA